MINTFDISIISKISQTIATHQKDLNELEAVLSQKVNKMKNFCYLHRQELKSYFREFKQIFKNLEAELIGDLPLVFQQFLEIMGKISEAYQEKIQKLTEEKDQWEISYNNLLFVTQNNSFNNEAEQIIKIQDEMEQKSQKMEISLQSQSINEFRLKSDDSFQIKDFHTHQNSFYNRNDQRKHSHQFWNTLKNQICSYESISKEKENRKKMKSYDINFYNKKNDRIMKRLANCRRNIETKRASLYERI